MAGRPRTPLGTHGSIHVRRRGRTHTAETRVRDGDGRLRRVAASAGSAAAARRELQKRLQNRPAPGYGQLQAWSSFADLVELWLAGLDLRDLALGTKDSYRDVVRLHVLPAFEHFTLGEITTGRVEWFLKSEAAVSYSQAMHSRTLLNLLFGFALRHDAITRNPVGGTSQLRKPCHTPQALTLAQIAAIREAAAGWRGEPGLPGPKSDGQVRDLIEVLLGTGMRPGEALALRRCDITEGPGGMVARVTGTVVWRKNRGAFRQDHPKIESSVRSVPVPEFAAEILRRRLAPLGPADAVRTIFANRGGGPLNPSNVRRTFRDMVKLAGLEETGISLRWYRRTAATVIARGMGVDAAATFLGHTSTVITEGHYIAPDPTIDHSPANHLEQTLRPGEPGAALLGEPADPGEGARIAALADADDHHEQASA